MSTVPDRYGRLDARLIVPALSSNGSALPVEEYALAADLRPSAGVFMEASLVQVLLQD